MTTDPHRNSLAAPTAGRARLRSLARWPLVVAPMAGGPSTVDLVVATTGAGALGFLAGGYKTAPALAEEMAAVRAAGVDTFGVNLFVPGSPTVDPEGLAAYVAELEPDAAALGVALGEAHWDDDDYRAKWTLCWRRHRPWSVSPSGSQPSMSSAPCRGPGPSSSSP